MTQTPTRSTKHAEPAAIARHRPLIDGALRVCVNALDDPRMRLIASYQLGWCDAAGRESAGHAGKALRPTLVLVAAEAAGGEALQAVAAAAAVELVHNFSLLHDDVMDRDTERRHRATGWAAFGEGPALLAGNAMLVAAVDLLLPEANGGPSAVRCLLDATQRLIAGQSDDLRLESAPDVQIDDVLRMEAGKTAALTECAARLGGAVAGAPRAVVDRLAAYGHHLGIAFQLVDDVLGLIGDPAVTGKPRWSDLRAAKRSAPIVAALNGGTRAGEELRLLLSSGPPSSEAELALAAGLVEEAGGIQWAADAARARLAAALAALAGDGLRPGGVAELTALARFVVDRDL